MAKIYVASSWRNDLQPVVVTALRAAGHEVYDFKNPESRTGFAWSQVEGTHELRGADKWPAAALREVLQHPVALAGFMSDHSAMEWADTFVMVLPCGKSAHLEIGWACGQGKRTFILMAAPDTPELMYLEADRVCASVGEILDAIGQNRAERLFADD